MFPSSTFKASCYALKGNNSHFLFCLPSDYGPAHKGNNLVKVFSFKLDNFLRGLLFRKATRARLFKVSLVNESFSLLEHIKSSVLIFLLAKYEELLRTIPLKIKRFVNLRLR